MAMEKQARKIYVIILITVTLLTSISPLSYAGNWRKFEAVGVEYNVNSTPQVKGSTFKSKVNIFSDGAVRVVQVDNYISGKRDPDIHIKVAISFNSAGSVIYDSEMKPIAEYPNGKIISKNLILFEQELEGRTLKGEWFIEEDYLMSDFSLVSSDGTLLFKETVVYRAK